MQRHSRPHPPSETPKYQLSVHRQPHTDPVPAPVGPPVYSLGLSDNPIKGRFKGFQRWSYTPLLIEPIPSLKFYTLPAKGASVRVESGSTAPLSYRKPGQRRGPRWNYSHAIAPGPFRSRSSDIAPPVSMAFQPRLQKNDDAGYKAGR
jgi:hypothetical protein